MRELSACRLCRREGLKLFLKGDRCYTDKCSYDRRNYPPGHHGQGRKKFTEYGVQLREKQKVKRLYGLDESQFRNTFSRAARTKGKTGDILLSILERRLDNVVYRLGFCGSRREARHFVRHGHFMVNDKPVNVPSFITKASDTISVREKSRKVERITDSMASVDRRGVPAWLELEAKSMSGMVKQLPTREDVSSQIQEQLIVELYSK